MRLFFLTLLLFATPAAADPNALRCEELWFARNAMMDQGGYCFKSPLGQSVFDNDDCTTSAPDLSPAAKAMVTQIVRNEAGLGCSVDTRKTTLTPGAVRDLDERRLLEVQPPVPSEWQAEFTCTGYVGQTLTLHAAPEAESDVLSTVPPGGTIDFDREVLIEGESFTVVSQLVVSGSALNPDDGAVLDGWNPYPDGTYWMYVRASQGGPSERVAVGWALLPPQGLLRPAASGGLCEGMAG